MVSAITLGGCCYGIPLRGYADVSNENVPILRANFQFEQTLVRDNFLRYQFPEVATNEAWQSNRTYFLFSGNLHYVNSTLPRIYASLADKTSIFTKDNVFLGSLTFQIDVTASRHEISNTFLDGSHLYYQFADLVERSRRNFMAEPVTHFRFYKFHYFRFCLISFTNEQVTINSFVEALNRNSTHQFKVNLNFRTR